MKLVRKLFVAALMLPGMAQVQLAMAIGEPIPGVDIVVKPGGGRNVTAPSKPTDAKPVGPAGAPVSTTRSNKRRADAQGTEANGAMGSESTTRGTAKKPLPGVGAVGPAGAPVNTTRSNKRRGDAKATEANSAMGNVSTTR